MESRRRVVRPFSMLSLLYIASRENRKVELGETTHTKKKKNSWHFVEQEPSEFGGASANAVSVVCDVSVYDDMDI